MEKIGGYDANVVLEMAGHPDSIRTAFDIGRGVSMSLLATEDGLTAR
jgi:hypothetical protein